MVGQHIRPSGGGPAPYVDMKRSILAVTQRLLFSWYCTCTLIKSVLITNYMAINSPHCIFNRLLQNQNEFPPHTQCWAGACAQLINTFITWAAHGKCCISIHSPDGELCLRIDEWVMVVQVMLFYLYLFKCELYLHEPYALHADPSWLACFPYNCTLGRIT